MNYVFMRLNEGGNFCFLPTRQYRQYRLYNVTLCYLLSCWCFPLFILLLTPHATALVTCLRNCDENNLENLKSITL